MDNSQRVIDIKQKLIDALSPNHIEVIDDSHKHVGHAGYSTGKGHFTVILNSSLFEGKRPIQCHQMVYAALDKMMETDIHALSIKIQD